MTSGPPAAFPFDRWQVRLSRVAARGVRVPARTAEPTGTGPRTPFGPAPPPASGRPSGRRAGANGSWWPGLTTVDGRTALARCARTDGTGDLFVGPVRAEVRDGVGESPLGRHLRSRRSRVISVHGGRTASESVMAERTGAAERSHPDGRRCASVDRARRRPRRRPGRRSGSRGAEATVAHLQLLHSEVP